MLLILVDKSNSNPLLWRHNGRDNVSNHQPHDLIMSHHWFRLWTNRRHLLPDPITMTSNHQLHDCLHNRLFGHKSKKTSKLRVTGLCAGNSPGTGVFPAQMASNAENVSIWWRHHVTLDTLVWSAHEQFECINENRHISNRNAPLNIQMFVTMTSH